MSFFRRWLKTFVLLIGVVICVLIAISLFALLVSVAPIVAMSLIVLVFLGAVAFALVSEAEDDGGW